MSGRRSRNKGARGEREAAAELSKVLPATCYRTAQRTGEHGDGDVKGLPGVHFEVKRCEKGNPYVWLDQAEEDANEEIPVVIHRRNNRRWIVIHYLDDLPQIMEACSGKDLPE